MIVFSNIEAEGLFLISLSNFNFTDVRFERGGSIMKFQHQTKETLNLANATFSNIYYGGITVESANKNAHAEKTKVAISSMMASDIDAQIISFIQLYEGAQIEVHYSNFSSISNLMYGAVLMAGYQKAKADIHDSIFTNNTSVEGGVFIVENESSIKCTN